MTVQTTAHLVTRVVMIGPRYGVRAATRVNTGPRRELIKSELCREQ